MTRIAPTPEAPMIRRFKPGDRVHTTRDAMRADWEGNEAARLRRFGVDGIVSRVHDAHGLVYEVTFGDGHSAYYEHDEVEVPR